jgi:hypothetical protein
MKMHDIPFNTVDWAHIPPEEKTANAGRVFWRTQQFGDIRVRMVEYTPGYVSDHWCVKGQVADNAEPHRSRAPLGAKLFIVD